MLDYGLDIAGSRVHFFFLSSKKFGGPTMISCSVGPTSARKKEDDP
jgi:hypothetical protein